MSLIKDLPKLETEGHWDSQLIGSGIRFPRNPCLWTEEELNALYKSNGLDTDNPDGRAVTARKYWSKMLDARTEQIKRDIIFKSAPVRPECALEQPLDILAAGVNYSAAEAHLASDAILILLADIEHDTDKQDTVSSDALNDDIALSIAKNLNDVIGAGVVGKKCQMFGISLNSLSGNRFEIILPSMVIQFAMNKANYERVIELFLTAADLVRPLLQFNAQLILPHDQQGVGGQCEIGVQLDHHRFFSGSKLIPAIPIKYVENFLSLTKQAEAEAVANECIESLLIQSLQPNETQLNNLLHKSLVTQYQELGLLKLFIKEYYQPENYGSLPDHSSLVATDSKAGELIEKTRNSHGSVIYRVFYNDITSNKLIVETSDWLFALKVYRGHCDINDSMRLGLKAG